MLVGLIDVDGHNFPNLALMKLSAWHKQRGDTVEWWNGLKHYDLVYKSKVFEDTAYGFLTRGCPRACEFCIVSQKEGRKSKRVADLSEFWDGQATIKLLDPNLLACPESEGFLEQLIDSRSYVDFTQGLDIRLTDKDNIELLNRVRTKRLHFAWDDPEEDLTGYFQKFNEHARIKDPSKRIVYVLTNYGSTHEEDLYRIYTLRDLGFDPYVMIHDKPKASKRTKDLQRWCNNRVIFKAQPDFSKYAPSMLNQLNMKGLDKAEAAEALSLAEIYWRVKDWLQEEEETK